jgi:cysteinyl-tRNA synthetase
MIAGARVEVAPYKKDPQDFILWKPSKSGEPGWPSPAGIKTQGRPGWHIECSAMAWKHLGETFDIHGGGIDLVFPHHENEIAQSRCAFHTPVMANYWMHNGFLQVEGEKMSKSVGNFVTIHELLRTDKFGGRRWPGIELRLAMLLSHYREPINFSVSRVTEAQHLVERFIRAAKFCNISSTKLDQKTIDLLLDDLDTYSAILRLRELSSLVMAVRRSPDIANDEEISYARDTFLPTAKLFGFEFAIAGELSEERAKYVNEQIAVRDAARAAKNFKESDRIRDELAAMGVVLKDSKDGTTWEIAR